MLVEDVFTAQGQSPRAAALKLQQMLAEFPLELHVTLSHPKGKPPTAVRVTYSDDNKLVTGWVDLTSAPVKDRVEATTPSGLIYWGTEFDVNRIYHNLHSDSMFKGFEQAMLSAFGRSTSPDQLADSGEDDEAVAMWSVYPPFNLPGHQVYDQYIVSNIVVELTTHSSVRVHIFDVNGDKAGMAEAHDLDGALKETAELIKKMTPDDMKPPDPSHDRKPYKRF